MGKLLPRVGSRYEEDICRSFSYMRADFAESITVLQSRAVIGTTGGWRNAELMARAVREQRIDMCGIARPLREEPDLVKRMLAGSIRVSHL